LAVRAKPKVFTKHFAQPPPATPPAAPVSGGSAGTSDGECKSDDAALEKDLYSAVFRAHRQTTVDVSDRLGSNPFAVRILFSCAVSVHSCLFVALLPTHTVLSTLCLVCRCCIWVASQPLQLDEGEGDADAAPEAAEDTPDAAAGAGSGSSTETRPRRAQKNLRKLTDAQLRQLTASPAPTGDTAVPMLFKEHVHALGPYTLSGLLAKNTEFSMKDLASSAWPLPMLSELKGLITTRLPACDGLTEEQRGAMKQWWLSCLETALHQRVRWAIVLVQVVRAGCFALNLHGLLGVCGVCVLFVS
jgi:hypothetical protein